MYEQIRKQLKKKQDGLYSENMLNKSLDDLGILRDHMRNLGSADLAEGGVIAALCERRCAGRPRPPGPPRRRG